MIECIVLKGKKIFYELQYKDVKNINLRIKSSKSIFVSANSSISQEVINEFLLSKTEYILNAVQYYEEIEKYAPKQKQYIDGESIKVLGRELRLKVISGNKNSVTCDQSYITVMVKKADDYELKRKLVDKWLNAMCIDTVKDLLRLPKRR